MLLLLALMFPWVYGNREGVSDSVKIARNGSANSLHEHWHAVNALKRGFILLSGSALLFKPFGFPLSAAFLLYSIAAFGCKFTTTLNTYRGLSRFYVSSDPRASKTDKFFVTWAAKLGMQPETFSKSVYISSLILTSLFLAFALVLCG